MPSTPDTWVVIGSPTALAALKPLCDAHRKQRPVRFLSRRAGDGLPTALNALGSLDALPPPGGHSELRDVAAVLVVGDPRRSPRHGLPGLFLHDDTGRRVPAGWLPNLPQRLGAFAQAAAKVVRRAKAGLARGPLILLGQWDDRTLLLAQQTESAFQNVPCPVPVIRWTAERLVQTDMLRGLRCGPGLAIYFGHGRPRGWAGYHGIRAQHLSESLGEPLGAILSITCHTANRWKVPVSFAEEMVLSGLCAASLGATSKTVHLDNGCLTNNLCSTLTDHSLVTLGELLLAARLGNGHAFGTYRIIGDPFAPLVGAAGALEKARGVFAPAPDDALPPLPDYAELETT
jgi:hypothetical protein